MNIKTIVASAIMVASLGATAEENLWVYTKATDTRPQGSWELKLSDISRIGKGSGYYAFHDIRPEVEYGITDRLTVGVEAMYFVHDYMVQNDGLAPMSDGYGNTDRHYSADFAGYELTLKYNVLSPYKDAFGLSFALGYENRTKYRLDGADILQDSYTATVFAQKNYLQDTLTVALNWKTEFEERTSPSDTRSDGTYEEEIAFDVSAGVSYRVKPKHFVGLEFRHQSDYLSPKVDGEYDDPTLRASSFKNFPTVILGTQHQNGNYVGPTYHYAEQNWWITAGVLFQIHGDGSHHAYNTHGRNYDEHEEVHLALIYGYEF